MGVTGSGGASGDAKWCVVVHGGAGDVPESRRVGHAEGCALAARAAAEVLSKGGGALDAAQAAVVVLEDDPRFNAGTGACLTDEGTLELDAALMDGRELQSGAVCALPPFRNPIAVARAVLDDARHVLLAGEGAARFAEKKGFTRAAPESMITEAVRERFAKGANVPEGYAGNTVGVAVRDARGGLAAATSTGGTFFKRVGRVGDTPLIGAGTYADDTAGAASATGIGEAIIRVCMTKTVIEWLRQGMGAEEAARASALLLEERGRGRGGIVLCDRRGRFGWARTTVTMSWAAMTDAMSAPLMGH